MPYSFSGFVGVSGFNIPFTLPQILTPDARDRLANIRVANPQLAESVEIQLIQLAQSGRIQGVINDAMLRDILRKVAPAHREITIERR